MDKNSPEYRAARRKRVRKYASKNLTKIAARTAVRMLTPKPCEVCGLGPPDVITEGHHDDYRKPYTVRWFCKEHHEIVDAEIDRRKT